MKHGKLLRIGGFASGGLLILFGIAVIVLGIWGSRSPATTSSRKGSSSGQRATRQSQSMLSSGRASRSRPVARRSRSPRSCASTRWHPRAD